MPASPQTPQMAVAMPMPQTAARPAPRERATAIRAVIRQFGPGETVATSQTDATASRCESMMRDSKRGPSCQARLIQAG